MTEAMSSENRENTLPLSEQLVRHAWLDFVASARPVISVPAFLAWLRDHQVQVLENVNKTTLVKIAERLCGAGEQLRSSPFVRELKATHGARR